MAMENTAVADLWRDPAAPAADRIKDLIPRMSVREKVAQLYGVWVGADATSGQVAPFQHSAELPAADWSDVLRDGVGQLTRPFGTAPVDPVAGARAIANTQRELTGTNLGIPALVHEECLTGLGAWQATVYPAPLCWGASFDPDLIREVGERIGTTMRRLGVHQGLAPVLDVARDLRWGRVEETIAEDPYLVGTLGAAYVQGLESTGIIATLKHFAGYSASRAGRNLAPVSVGPREMADVILPPFEMALHAGARSVMNSYADNDGMPVAGDPAMLTDLLRGTYGFTGTVVSDYFAVVFLHRLHRTAGSKGTAAVQALQAGIDVELPTVDCFGAPLIAALEAGEVDVALVDRALERVLLQKCELGLLDADWSPEAPILSEQDPRLDDEESRALAGRLARRAIVLLRNENGALPLAPGKRVAVVGPRAHVADAAFGCYSFPRHIGVHHPDLALGIEARTVLEALQADPAGYVVSYAQGCPIPDTESSVRLRAERAAAEGGAVGGEAADTVDEESLRAAGDQQIAEAVAAAREAEVCVAVLGDVSGLFGNGTSGEGCDASDLRLPGRQGELLEALLGTGTPVVLVLLVGRPYELSRYADRLAAVVCGFLPGEEGANALADVLSGRVDPAGRLPVGFPAEGANQPSTYLTAALGLRSDVSTVDPTPLYPFGHGLSYNPAVWTDIALPEGEAWPTDGTLRLAVTLRNDGASATSEVVQVYLHDPEAEVARPVQQLIAAPRVDLAPGTTRTVLVDLPADTTSYTGRAGRRIVEPGEVELWVGASSRDIRARLAASVVGARREVGFDRAFQPEVSVVEG
ncbi:glycoside hydrolase family 3 domain protein [Catenulispora acidiphila DSM 44928]|uniref:Glycoside hydrolase family 3 domain protein n=1 Tax=Catenulispora acidiphila (strain DSM 44928 / JCM 14897 / NBRC 102108 / NRRL B-24433 / ID139908) TaxID=479433 RepID=C7QAJ1_CATAD|nr:glycoside hydrolase family 3 N-terminal domain-containing protein [Catenulispora acidiphila]ACU72490.1 glycoside hydrolase family 3 domain protein [Catenulispora acidiphila DSM 44928]